MNHILLDIATMDKVDAQGMYKIYDSWPEIARESFESHHEPVDFHDIDHIVFAGMGGSGTIGTCFPQYYPKAIFMYRLSKDTSCQRPSIKTP